MTVECEVEVTPAADRVLQRCTRLAAITDEPGRITRGFLSPAMERVNAKVAGWMQDAGLQTELDVGGNLIGTLACGEDDAPVLVLGSHLDTVRDAGAYDGVLGVLLALTVIEQLEGARLPFDIDIVAFSDEEGLRYGVPFLGSRMMTGELDPAWLERRDEGGVPMAEAIANWGGDPQQVECRYSQRRCLGYLEPHIEQGIVLEHHDQPLGILQALSCACWLRLRFDGRAGHAGTTPMNLRRDPMPAAAEVVLAAERIAGRHDGMVATVGTLEPRPGAGNVIAGSVELSLDMRHPDSRCLQSALDELLDECRQVAERRDLGFEHEVLHHQDGVEADAGLSDLLAEAVHETDTEARRLLIGAGHDALIMAQVMPVAMLLLRSPGGVSHHPEESVLPGDVVAALDVLSAFVRRLARAEAKRSGEPVEDCGWPAGVAPADAATSLEVDP